MKLKNIDGTEINGMGPDIAADQVSALREKINQLKAGDILVLAGSIPQSMPDTIYWTSWRIFRTKALKSQSMRRGIC